MPGVVHELLATEVVLGKLGARDISADEASQVARNRRVTVRNPHAGGEPDKRRLLTGMTDGGRALTFVIEQHEGDPDAKLRILLSVEGEDARRLERVAEARGKSPADVIAELLRDADHPAA